MPINAQATSLGNKWATIIVSTLFIVIFIGTVYLRFADLGAKSLWSDEFCTWRVSRMPFGESIRWGPELTKPPLYQLAIRALTTDPKPSEFQLRLPAALCGVLVVMAGAWVGAHAAGWPTGVACAALLGCNALQIDYSQEARSYSMLVLGCTVGTYLWHRLVTNNRIRDAILYVLVVTVSFHAHYLMVLTVTAHLIWWGLQVANGRVERGVWRPVISLGAVVVLCSPMTIHFLRYRSSVFQGLDWIPPATGRKAIEVLEQLTFGRIWVLGVLVPAAFFILSGLWGVTPRYPRARRVLVGGSRDPVVLLLLWLICAWLGLTVISKIAQPVLVTRYALPAAVPAILIPLIVAHRIHRWIPLGIAMVFVIHSAPQWLNRSDRLEPGFREMVVYLNENVDREKAAVVLATDSKTTSGWADVDGLGFDYYPLDNIPVHTLDLNPRVLDGDLWIVTERRSLYWVSFVVDTEKVLGIYGRKIWPFEIENNTYAHLLFAPYRLTRTYSTDP